jgi:hypothetical protein
VSVGRDTESHRSQEQRRSVEDHRADRTTASIATASRAEDGSARLVESPCGPADEGISQVGRVEVEGGGRSLMMNSMMLDLESAQLGHEGNPGENPIDGVVLEVSEPVADLEREVVEKRRGQEHERRIERRDRGQEHVVARQ